MPIYHFIPETFHLLTWFEDSPNAGDPGCICSLCKKLIEEVETPLRMIRERDNHELRLHRHCAEKSIRDFGKPQPNYEREQWEDELSTIEDDLLPDVRRQLADLEGPDYKPEENRDHDLLDDDIDGLISEIKELTKRAKILRKKLGYEVES